MAMQLIRVLSFVEREKIINYEYLNQLFYSDKKDYNIQTINVDKNNENRMSNNLYIT